MSSYGRLHPVQNAIFRFLRRLSEGLWSITPGSQPMPALVVVTTFGQQTFDSRRHHGYGFRDWSGQSFGRHMKCSGWKIGACCDSHILPAAVVCQTTHQPQVTDLSSFIQPSNLGMILARMNPHSWRVATGRAGFLLTVIGVYGSARCINLCRIIHSARERERGRASPRL